MSTNNSLDYDYESEPEAPALDTEMLITGLVYGITFIVGVIGNGLIIYSVSHFRTMKSLSNIFLANLASADLMLITVCVPVKFTQLFSYTWTVGEFLCKFVHYTQNVSAICSVFTLTAMSIERYYAIMHPVKCRYICTMSQTKRIIVMTWFLSLIMAAPVYWIQIHREVGVKVKAYWCVRDWSKTIPWQAYECYMLIIILLAPFAVMTYSYAHICMKMFYYELPNSTRNVQVNANTGQVIKMLIAVIVIFLICWSPILIINVLTSFGIIEPLNYGNLKAIRTAAHLFSYANSCVNPIIYGFMSHSFRASFKAAITKCFTCNTSSNVSTFNQISL